MAFLVQSAAAQVGGAGVVFLKIEPDSRAAGMGNSGVALADNASAIFWNPAGLAFQTGSEAGITHFRVDPLFLLQDQVREPRNYLHRTRPGSHH